MKSKLGKKTIFQLDAHIKDPLTVIKFLAEEIRENTKERSVLRKKINLLLLQIKKIVAILKRATDSFPKDR